MTEFIILAVVLFIGIISGWYLREYRAMHIVNKMMKELDTKIEQDKENSIRVNIEKHNGHFYVFEHETDKFLGQAETMDELDAYLAKHFPGKKFFVKESQLESIGVKS